ncbi:DgyrCDS5886 [Dimorphilus gyrociliatus]|uniref:DgyrCDS5886 n=1 Tax=Dimorphilus gyrociliatus TaxID=2664684 RepID=A0A7I8VR46_9ANNE|nr:DgyrCDS5886 [Dimorphilus gyrociliatus]
MDDTLETTVPLAGHKAGPSLGSKKPSVVIKEPERTTYEVVKIEEKHGPLHKAIPIMPLPFAALCCLLNIGCPGLGTLISAFSVFCCASTRIEKPIHAFGLNILAGILQALTFIVIVGWIWSILWGMTFVQFSSKYIFAM